MPVITFIGFCPASRVYIPPLVYNLQDKLRALLKIPQEKRLLLALCG